jgi:ABC-type sugar transport system substrate-binding protein
VAKVPSLIDRLKDAGIAVMLIRTSFPPATASSSCGAAARWQGGKVADKPIADTLARGSGGPDHRRARGVMTTDTVQGFSNVRRTRFFQALETVVIPH